MHWMNSMTVPVTQGHPKLCAYMVKGDWEIFLVNISNYVVYMYILQLINALTADIHKMTDVDKLQMEGSGERRHQVSVEMPAPRSSRPQKPYHCTSGTHTHTHAQTHTPITLWGSSSDLQTKSTTTIICCAAISNNTQKNTIWTMIGHSSANCPWVSKQSVWMARFETQEASQRHLLLLPSLMRMSYKKHIWRCRNGRTVGRSQWWPVPHTWPKQALN